MVKMTERELFEAWISKKDWIHAGMSNRSVDDILCFDDDYRAYHFRSIQECWEAWQASANREGFKIVPVELSWEEADDLASAEWGKNAELFRTTHRDLSALQVEQFRLKWCRIKAYQIMDEYKKLIGAVG